MPSPKRRSGFVKLVAAIVLAIVIGFAGATIQHLQRYGGLQENFSVFCEHEGLEFVYDKKAHDRERKNNKLMILDQEAKQVDEIVRPYAVPFNVSVLSASSGKDNRFSFRVLSNKYPVEIKKIRALTKESNFDFTWKKLESADLEFNEGAKHGILVVGILKKGHPAGYFEETIEIDTLPLNGKKTTEDDMQTLSVTAEFRVESAYSISLLKAVKYRPSHKTVILGLVPKTQELNAEIGVSIKVPTENLKVEIADNGIQPKGTGLSVKLGKVISNENGSLIPVQFHVPKDCPKVAYLSSDPKDLVKVVLKTNLDSVKEIEFFVSFAKE